MSNLLLLELFLDVEVRAHLSEDEHTGLENTLERDLHACRNCGETDDDLVILKCMSNEYDLI